MNFGVTLVDERDQMRRCSCNVAVASFKMSLIGVCSVGPGHSLSDGRYPISVGAFQST